MAKSEEQWQSEIDGLNSKMEALVNSKADILDEKKKLEKKYKEVDTDEYFKLRDDFDKLSDEHKKLEKSNGVLTKDLEKSNATVTERDGSLRKLIVDDGIAKALNALEKHKLNDGALGLATMDITSRGVEVVDGVAMIGDKNLNDFITGDWINDTASRNLLTPNENSGGGAGGGTNTGGNADIKFGDMSPTEMMKHGRQ